MNTKPLLKTEFIKWIYRVMRWILHTYSNLFSLNDIKDRPKGKLYLPLLLKLDRVLQTRGKVGLITYVKSLRSSFHCFLSGSSERVSGIKCDSYGCPLILKPLVRFEESTLLTPDFNLRLVETILFCTRALETSYVFSGKTIEQPAKQQVPSSIFKYTKDFWKSLGYWPSRKVPRALRWSSYHFTTKAGPNGHALQTCLSDLAGLPYKLYKAICVVGGKGLKLKMQDLLQGWDILYEDKPHVKDHVRVRKLVAFPDKEGQTREVAILDFWSQTALRPLHSFLYRVLKKIPQDCTFNQGHFKELLKNSSVVYSVDLTAATDRFPIWAIEKVLKGLLPSWYVRNWHTVMVGRPFFSQDAGRYLSYRVGNPMGAYSSWASFAVAHHYIVYSICRDLGKEWKTLPYALLGDDIAIGDKQVAEEYIRRMTEDLGVEISTQKSHVSPNFYEFAKRLVYRGEEITHFPISSLKESEKRYYQLVNLLLEQETRGWVTSNGGPIAISEYYNSVKMFRRKRSRHLGEKSYLCERVMKIARGLQSASDSLNELTRKLNLPIRPLTEEEANGILINVCVEVFADSNPENQSLRKGTPAFGEKARALTQGILVKAGTENEVHGLKLIDAHPLIGVYSDIENSFIELKMRSTRFDRAVSARDCLAVKAMVYPRNDLVFTMRTKDIINLVSSVVGNHLTERLVFLSTPYGRAMLG